MKKYYMIGNTHFDPVWLWHWDEAMSSIRATFRSALDRMKEYPDFIYSFCTPPVFEWIKKTDPELFEEICQRVAEGRWALAEGWWLQPDCYLASGESYIRQGYYGQKYLKENFGKYSECVFNIDSFGHSPMLPQILRKSGIKYYCFVRPERHHLALEDPFFRWESPDGSAVFVYRAENCYSKNLAHQLETDTTPHDALIVYGITDHGGAPTKKLLDIICSNENTLFSTLSGFFRTHTPSSSRTGDLITGDFGVFSNYVKIKKGNRIAEYAALNAERASLIAGRNEQITLDSCWKDILFNQFHDILGGACTKEAYTVAGNMMGRAVMSADEIKHFSLQSVTRQIQMPGKNPDNPWNIVAWNLNGAEYDGCMEAEVQWMHEFDPYTKGLCLEDSDGNRYPCQIIRELSVIPGFRSRFLFKAKIPSVGYKAFKLIQTHEEVSKAPVSFPCVETDTFSFLFSETDGTLLRVTDKKSGKQLLGKALVPVAYRDQGDTWCFNTSKYEEEPIHPQFLGVEVIESGALLTKLKVNYRLNESKLSLYYCFYQDAPYFDLEYRVNWEEKHTVLKLETAVNSYQHTVSVPAGSIQRSENAADMPMGAWLQTDTALFLCDSAFAYNMHSGKLGITLLRSPIFGDLRLDQLDDSIDYDFIDLGVTEGRMRISFAGDPCAHTDSFNNRPTMIIESNHSGSLPAQNSYLQLLSGHAYVSAFKQNENGCIIRLIETSGETQNITLTALGRTYSTLLSPFEIKTLQLCGGDLTEVSLLEEPLS